MFEKPYFDSIVVFGEPSEVLWFSLDGDIVQHVAQVLKNYNSSEAYYIGKNEALTAMFNYTIYNRGYARMDINKYVTGFVEMFLSYLPGIENGNSGVAKSSIVRKALSLIEMDYDKLTVEGLAKRIHVDSRYLSRLFKIEVGKSPKQYLTDTKLNYAEHYIRNSDYSVMTIAEMVGYPNYTNFYTAFRERYGMTPSEYRLYCTEKSTENHR